MSFDIRFELQRFRNVAAKPHGCRWIGRDGAGDSLSACPSVFPDGDPHLRGFRFLYDFRGETVLVVPLDFGFWRVPRSVPMGGGGFTALWSNGSLTPLLPGFRSVDIFVSLLTVW